MLFSASPREALVVEMRDLQRKKGNTGPKFTTKKAIEIEIERDER
tara:strand:- start:29 stop:163 length:135 start_codon:yes stop_codon:yes gene_type:complete